MPTAREHLVTSVVDGKLYAIGGFATGIGNFDVNEAYNLQNDSWETLAPMPTARNGITSSELNGVIFVFGGENTIKTFNENEAYMPQEDVWYTLQPLPIPRQGLFSSAVGDTIYVMGGGFVTGASYSNLNHAYQNNSIPEFGTIAILVLISSAIAAIFASRYIGRKQVIMQKNGLS
jgi:predicted secreted protein with PEFG-CTERM motif